MVCTRPTISNAVSVVRRYSSCPEMMHWEAIKWILCYLKSTIDAYLEFGRIYRKLAYYVDLDFMDDLDKRLSLTSYVFTLGGCVISWKATFQTTIALSTTKAKFMALADGIKEEIWLKGLLGEISTYGGPTIIYYDN